jgi:hypothetical protein
MARRVALVGGPAVVLGVAWATAGVRDTMGIVNATLLLAAVTVLIAVLDGAAGVVTSVVAAMALNYFHTEPVHSFRIDQRSDLLATLLLATAGLTASAATAINTRRFVRHRASTEATHGRSLVVTAGSQARPADLVWAEAVQASSAELSLVDCRIEPVGASNLPTIARLGQDIDAPSTFVLPQTGAVIRLRDPRNPAQVVLSPRHRMGPVTLDRRAVIAFVDQLELTIDRSVSTGTGRATL